MKSNTKKNIKNSGKHILYALASAGMAWAATTQFYGAEERGAVFFVALAALFALGWLGLCYAAPRVSVRQVAASLVWGVGLAFALVIGKALDVGDGGLWPYEAWGWTALRLAGLSALFALALACWMVRTPRAAAPQDALKDAAEGAKKDAQDAQKEARAVRRWFFASWAIVAVSRIPYFLNFYPAFITYDTVAQYTEVFEGALTNLHPFLHTLSLGLALRVGAWLGLREAAALAGYAAAQALLQAAVYAWLIAFLRRRARTLWAPALALAYLALHPLHALYAVTLWKDIPFGLAIAALALLLFRVAETRGACLRKGGFFAALLAALIGVSLLRNNGVIVTAAAAVALIAWRPARQNRAALLAGVAVGVVALIQLPLFSLLHIQTTPVTEAISVPIQQIGFVVREHYPLTEEQEDDIDEVIPLDVLAEVYDPTTVDTIKFQEDFDGEYLREYLGEYARMWLEIGLQYPAAYAEAHGLLTLRYWYPPAPPQARFYANPTPSDAYRHYPTEPLTDAFLWLNDLSPRELVEAHPWLAPLFGHGVLIWVLLAACACLWARREARYQLALLPLLAVWIPLMLGTPLAESRYIYPLYCCLPLMLWMTAPRVGKHEGRVG
ncbi:MAG: DUF6020 family protein [Clostridia bacterium]|nr:DUF6020 family protein [Clostridia bacterium]